MAIVAFALVCVLLFACFACAQQSATFPFPLNSLAAPKTPIDLSALNKKPAGADGYIRVQGGHFVDGAGRRIRFLGTNLTFAAAFPDKSKAQALAARMSQFGINVVRLHHLDNQSAPGGIWNKDKTAFDPEQLDRLDMLIYQLKQHGIYVNINLHVSRNYPGLPKDRTYRYGKVLDNFYPQYIQMQKDYARALLTHVNRYTKTPYAKEPAVAFVEINNENTLLGAPLSKLRELPEPFLSELTRQWRRWLKQRYGTTEALRRAWDIGAEPLGGELLRNGNFAAGLDGWTFEQGNGAKLSAEVAPGPRPGERALLVTTLRPGKLSWNLQVHQVGLTLREGKIYTLAFQAKSDEPRTISVGVRLDQAPWTFVGLSVPVKLSTEWQKFSFSFVAANTAPGHVRVSFNLQNALGRFWFANVSLRPGGTVGLAEGLSLEADNIPLPPPNASRAQLADFLAFKADTERAYVAEMVRFLKQELGVQANIVDTQASYGALGGVLREATLCDYIDIHAYWQHPHFPNRPWDRRDWVIGNSPLVRESSGGTLTRLAAHRVAGKPFTVSEYDHSAPSEYCAEMFPMYASFAAFQDWDGIYQFCYGRQEEPRIESYFAMRNHPGKMCFVPVAAVMFRMGAVHPARMKVTLTVPQESVLAHLASGSGAVQRAWEKGGVSALAALCHAVQIRLVPGKGQFVAQPKVQIPQGVRQSDTGEIVWDTTDPKQATYLVNAPAVRAAVGYVAGRKFNLGDVTVRFGQSANNFASFALAALDGRPIAQSKRLLLVACGRVENTGMVWNDQRTSVADRWGTAPTVVEGIALQVTVPGSLARVAALDGTAVPQAEVPTSSVGGATVLDLGPSWKTVWYYLER